MDYGDRKPLLKFISKEIKMTKYIDRYYLNWEMYAIKFPELVTVWSINNPQFVWSNTTSTNTIHRNNLEFSADWTFLYYWENTTRSGPTQITLSTPWDVASSTTSVTNIPDMMYGSGWNWGGCPRFIPDGSICWSCYGYTVRKFTLNTPRDLTQWFSFVDYSAGSEGITRWRIFADEGRKIIAQWLHVYNLSTPYDISTTDRINYQENTSLNCGDCWIFISDDWLHLYAWWDFSGTYELRHYELSSPYDISSPTLLETALGSDPQICWVYFHDNKMYTLCSFVTPEIKEWTVTTS